MELVKIDKSNWYDVIMLTTDTDGKHLLFEEFVTSNAFSLLQSSYDPAWTCRGIMEEGSLVGFTMFGWDEDWAAYSICRLMIDRRYQGKGYGSHALSVITKALRDIPDCKDIYLSTEPTNALARHVYEKFGFQSTGKIVDDELVYLLSRDTPLPADITVRSLSLQDAAALSDGFTGQGWAKPAEQFERYFKEQEDGSRYVFVAEYQGLPAGYVTLLKTAVYGPFASQDISEISDLNVFTKYQRNGIGTKLLDAAEKKAHSISSKVCLGVGLHSGYGAAQRMYMKRGYLPDGSGVWYQDKPAEQYFDLCNDDRLILYLSKDLD